MVARDAPRHNGGKLIAEIWVQCKRVARLGVDWGFMKKATTLRRSHKSAISSGTLSLAAARTGGAGRSQRPTLSCEFLRGRAADPVRRTRRVRHFERPRYLQAFHWALAGPSKNFRPAEGDGLIWPVEGNYRFPSKQPGSSDASSGTAASASNALGREMGILVSVVEGHSLGNWRVLQRNDATFRGRCMYAEVLGGIIQKAGGK